MFGVSKCLLCVSIAAIAAVACLAPTAASAATITPNVLTDELDDTNTSCSLLEALSIANLDSTAAEPDCPITNGGLGDDTINLGVGSYVLTISGALENDNETGDLNTAETGGDLTIDGAGVSATAIDAHGLGDRVLHHDGASPLVLSELTITGGDSGIGSGGGIFASDGTVTLESARVTDNEAFSQGGGIHETDDADGLTIIDSTIDDNTTTQGSGGGGLQTFNPTTIESSAIVGNHATYNGATGGGITALTQSVVTITDSLIAGNTAQSTGSDAPSGGGIVMEDASVTARGTTISGNQVLGGGERAGGAVHVTGTSTLTIVNGTVSDNRAELAAGFAGGIVETGGTVNLVHTTVGPNPSGSSPSALSRIGGTLNVRGSVIESPVGLPACGGTITSGGFNVFTDASCGTPTGSDEADADPLLAALADNGGPDAGAPGQLQPIRTHLPARSSTVVDHVPAASCDDEIPGAPLLGADQRGLGRPFDGDGLGIAECDAGSVEFQSADIPPTPPAGGAPTPTSTPPVAKKKCKKKAKRAVATKKKCKKRKR